MLNTLSGTWMMVFQVLTLSQDPIMAVPIPRSTSYLFDATIVKTMLVMRMRVARAACRVTPNLHPLNLDFCFQSAGKLSACSSSRGLLSVSVVMKLGAVLALTLVVCQYLRVSLLDVLT